MPSRRTHQKSRLGCLQCKRRRVKCDEERPRCSSCVSRGVLCEYATSSPLRWPKQSPPKAIASPQGTTRNFERLINSLSIFDHFVHAGNNSGITTPAAASASLPPPFPDMQQLELMAEWCTSTSLTVARDQPTQHIWSDLVPKEALSHLFLMHGVLGLSALHLGCCPHSERPVATPESYFPTALSHQCRAIALFRGVLDDINASNANAVYSFVGITLTFAFGYPRPPPSAQDPLAPVEELCRVFLLARGIQEVLNTARDWVLDGEFGHLLQLDGYTPFMPDDARSALDQLRNLNAACGDRDARHETEVYAHTIDQIGLMQERYHGGCSRPSLAALWAIKVPERYLVLLQAHEPMALVILANFCVVLHGVSTRTWFQNGWASLILRAIWMYLPPDWRSPMEWPMEMTGEKIPAT